jgi:hypothetical protein
MDPGRGPAGLRWDRHPPRLVTVCEEGSEAVSRLLAIVWPCPLPVDAYVMAGSDVEVPCPVGPLCAGPLVFWSGYWRHVRAAGRCRKIFVPLTVEWRKADGGIAHLHRLASGPRTGEILTLPVSVPGTGRP